MHHLSCVIAEPQRSLAFIFVDNRYHRDSLTAHQLSPFITLWKFLSNATESGPKSGPKSGCITRAAGALPWFSSFLLSFLQILSPCRGYHFPVNTPIWNLREGGRVLDLSPGDCPLGEYPPPSFCNFRAESNRGIGIPIAVIFPSLLI